MSFLKKTDPELFEAINKEVARQVNTIELIASENFTSLAVMEAQGSVMTNKYAEGYPAKRWYNGCENVDIAESLAIARAKEIFGAEHVNVQPHSGSQANMAVYFAALEMGDTVLAMDLSHGGHLTHGHKMNFSGRYYNIVPYGVSQDTETIDYDELEKKAKEVKPKMILAGASAYPRTIDFKRLREICDKFGAILMVDIAHIAGLVAVGLHPSPVPYAEFVTTTTHKTLRGPRGGMIMCRESYAKAIDSQVFPGIQGGPLMHVIAAKAVALKEAQGSDFVEYQKQVLANAKMLSKSLAGRGFRIVSGGTDTHLMLVDMSSKELTGKAAATALEKVNITVNKNMIPFDKASAFVTSGIRLGTPAVTTRGMKEEDMKVLGSLIADTLENIEREEILSAICAEVKNLCKKFPLYPELASKVIKN